jgi:hypothetical protein
MNKESAIAPYDTAPAAGRARYLAPSSYVKIYSSNYIYLAD